MVAHSNHKNGTAVNVFATESVLPGLVNFVYDRFVGSDLVRSVLLIPLEPLAPLLDGFLTVKLAGD